MKTRGELSSPTSHQVHDRSEVRWRVAHNRSGRARRADRDQSGARLGDRPQGAAVAQIAAKLHQG